MKQMPLTIENRWDILYRNYPEVYAEFAAVPKQPRLLPVLMQRFDFQGKAVADIGSGSGASSFEFASAARRVIGVEIEDAMRELAEQELQRGGFRNVEFRKGDGRNIPLPDQAVDLVTGITLSLYPAEEYRDFVREAARVTRSDGRSDGWIVMLNIAPGWYGGELASIILDEDSIETRQNEILVDELGFGYEDVDTYQEYGSLDRILRTYGFIFGLRAIEYLRKHNKTNIHWRFRIHYKQVEKE